MSSEQGAGAGGGAEELLEKGAGVSPVVTSKSKKTTWRSWWLQVAQESLATVMGVLFFGMLAIYAPVFAVAAGVPLSNLQIGAAIGGIAFSVYLVFGPYMGGFLSFSLLFADFLMYCDNHTNKASERKNAWNIQVWGAYLILAFFQAGAWFMIAGISFSALSDPVFGDRTAALTIVPLITGPPGLSYGYIYGYELLGKGLLVAAYIFCTKYFRMWGAFAQAVLYGVLVFILTPLTGGSLNFWRSFAVAAVEGHSDGCPGNVDDDPLCFPLWAGIVTELLAPILVCLIKVLFFPTGIVPRPKE